MITDLHKGRVGRARFSITIIIAEILYELMLFSVPESVMETGYFLKLYYLTLAVATYYITCVTIRRLHDIDWSGYVVVILFVPIMIMTIGGALFQLLGYENLSVTIIAALITKIISLCLVILLMCKSGQKNDNQFGPMV